MRAGAHCWSVPARASTCRDRASPSIEARRSRLLRPQAENPTAVGIAVDDRGTIDTADRRHAFTVPTAKCDLTPPYVNFGRGIDDAFCGTHGMRDVAAGCSCCHSNRAAADPRIALRQLRRRVADRTRWHGWRLPGGPCQDR